MKVCVIGLGYIGLPTAIVLADKGIEVIGYDINDEKVRAINSGDPVIEEPDLANRLRNVLTQKKLYATSLIQTADLFIICVPTPFYHNKTADLSYVWNAGAAIASCIKKGAVVILESTVPVGTTEQLADFIQEKSGLKKEIDFFVVHCPERVLPGKIFFELVHNSRIIGGLTDKGSLKAKHFYASFVQGDVYITTSKIAEFVKLVENTSRDVGIAFANEIANMAYEAHLDPFEIIELANKHPRVNILQPSCGVGGHCIAVDPWFLIETFLSSSNLIKKARELNDEKPKTIIKTIEDFSLEWLHKHKKKCTIAILGVTYKPNIDDLRESPALYIAKSLTKNPYCTAIVCEPHVQEDILTNHELHAVSYQEALTQADIVLCLVKHAYFRLIKKELLEEKILFDYCGLFYTHTHGKTYKEDHATNSLEDISKVNIIHGYGEENVA